MAVFFSTAELLDIAIAIEQHGEVYYQRLAAKTLNKDARVIYGFLAGEEKKHLELFKTMQKTADKYHPPESYTGEYMQYMEALIKSRIFDSIEAAVEVAEKLTDETEALALGIKIEKDSILFYSELQNSVPESDRQIIYDIVNEEKGHLRQLADLRSFIRKGEKNGSRE